MGLLMGYARRTNRRRSPRSGGMGDDGRTDGKLGRAPGGLAIEEPVAHPVADEGFGVTFDVRRGESILDAALGQGIELAHGCRHGVCGACAVEIVEGEENLVSPDDIERNSLGRFRLPANVRLACRAGVRGPVRIKPKE